MGRLCWREKNTRLGCWRGWLGILGLAAFALAGYFTLYAWLRATNVVVLVRWTPSGSVFYAGRRDKHTDSQRTDEWPRSWMMKAMWPAVKLEVVLHRRGWLPEAVFGKSLLL